MLRIIKESVVRKVLYKHERDNNTHIIYYYLLRRGTRLATYTLLTLFTTALQLLLLTQICRTA